MRIASDFEGGKIECTKVERIDDLRSIARLKILPDTLKREGSTPTSFKQGFLFDVCDRLPNETVELVFENAGACTWPDAWSAPYGVFATRGDVHERLVTSFDKKVMRASVGGEDPSPVRISSTPPYETARLTALHELVRGNVGCRVELVGRSFLDRSIEVIHLGERSDMPHVWVLAQQHPGEAMAGWFAEGLVERWLARKESTDSPNLHVVARMNPDGVALGNHRTSGAGIDLNRQWENPAKEAPEVIAVRNAIKAVGVNFFLDVHGEERMPYVFAQPADRTPSRSAKAIAAEHAFEALLLKKTPEYQTEHRYPSVSRTEPFMPIASTYVGHTYGCGALTLEMPFGDNALLPQPHGWSPARSKAFGMSVVEALFDLTPALR